MPKFKFEVVATVLGGPDPGTYPPGLSHHEELDTCAKVVEEEFATEEVAILQQEEYSEVWFKHKPSGLSFNDPNGAGLDVIYIGPVEELASA